MTDVRFLLDEHMSRAVVEGLHRREVTASTVHQQGRRGLSDESHLEWALAEGWVMVSGDRDFLRLARALPHAGVVFYHRDRIGIGAIVLGLWQIAQRESLESLRGRVLFLNERSVSEL